MMKKLFVSYLVLCAVVAMFSLSAAAQNCPKISMLSPSDDTEPGTMMLIMAFVEGGDPNVKPTYNWVVSAGRIARGQGTREIDVDTTGLAGQAVTATVIIGGYSSSCSTANSTTSVVKRAPDPARKIDEFGAMVRTEDQYARLDNYAIELQNDPTTRAVLLFYAGKRSRKGAIEALTAQTMKYLTNTRGLDPARILTHDGGFRDNGLIELWIVPPGAELPTTWSLGASEVQQLPALKKPPVKKPVKKPAKKS